MIFHILIAVSTAVAPLPAVTAESGETNLSLENRSLLRCAAAFALVTRAQKDGQESAMKWPELGDRGREFFVRAMAQVMDQTGYDREGIARVAGVEAQQIQDSGELDKMMPACLVMLENSGT